MVLFQDTPVCLEQFYGDKLLCIDFYTLQLSIFLTGDKAIRENNLTLSDLTHSISLWLFLLALFTLYFPLDPRRQFSMDCNIYHPLPMTLIWISKYMFLGEGKYKRRMSLESTFLAHILTGHVPVILWKVTFPLQT